MFGIDEIFFLLVCLMIVIVVSLEGSGSAGPVAEEVGGDEDLDVAGPLGPHQPHVIHPTVAAPAVTSQPDNIPQIVNSCFQNLKFYTQHQRINLIKTLN